MHLVKIQHQLNVKFVLSGHLLAETCLLDYKIRQLKDNPR